VTGKTHLAFNAAVAAALCSAGIINWQNPGAGALIGGVMLGSILPDIDSPNSKINYIIRRLLILKGLRRAAFCDPILSEHYQSLKSRGKHHLTAIGAVSRKMCNIIFTILKENRPYQATPPKKQLEESP